MTTESEWSHAALCLTFTGSDHQACGILDYFHHGGGEDGVPEGHALSNYLCDNIKGDEYLKVTTPSAGCKLVTALREGIGSDNPVTWLDVLAGPSGGFTCEDYDLCPSNGVSGYARGPSNAVVDIKTCATDGSEGAGLFPQSSVNVTARLRGEPMRYTMPKFVCFTYPAGLSSFELTYHVGPNPGAPPYYGRNFFFSGAYIVAADASCTASER